MGHLKILRLRVLDPPFIKHVRRKSLSPTLVGWKEWSHTATIYVLLHTSLLSWSKCIPRKFNLSSFWPTLYKTNYFRLMQTLVPGFDWDWVSALLLYCPVFLTCFPFLFTCFDGNIASCMLGGADVSTFSHPGLCFFLLAVISRVAQDFQWVMKLQEKKHVDSLSHGETYLLTYEWYTTGSHTNSNPMAMAP